MTWVAAAFAEAWQELRVHRTRVVLALLGIVIAVAAITLVTGMGSATRHYAMESSDRFGGRPASVTASITGDASPEHRQRADEAFATFLERNGVTHGSRVARAELKAQFVDGVAPVSATGVDQPFADMRRVPLIDGRWLEREDAGRLAPAVVVSHVTYARMGAPPLSEHPTIQITAPEPKTAVVVGVYDAGSYATQQELYLLADDLAGMRAAGGADGGGFPEYSVWVPEGAGQQFKSALQRDLKAALGSQHTVSAQRTDLMAQGGDPFEGMASFIAIVSSIVLAIGAVGFINLAIVTVKQRIREIGIRRSFGATAGRVFFAVLLESFVGTVLAGVVGIAIAAIVLPSMDLASVFSDGVTSGTKQPFPVEAALVGLGVSALVGLLAGIIPAVIATRVRVIDAIRGG